MQKHERTGKRLLALVLALVMALSTVTECLAAVTSVQRPVGEAEVTMGKLLAEAYSGSLTDSEKALLKSGYLAGDKAYVFTPPAADNSNGLVTIDKDSRKITVRSYENEGFTWLPVKAEVKVGDVAQKEIPLTLSEGIYTGSFADFDGLSYSIAVAYEMSVDVDTDVLNRMMGAASVFSGAVNVLKSTAEGAASLEELLLKQANFSMNYASDNLSGINQSKYPIYKILKQMNPYDGGGLPASAAMPDSKVAIDCTEEEGALLKALTDDIASDSKVEAGKLVSTYWNGMSAQDLLGLCETTNSQTLQTAVQAAYNQTVVLHAMKSIQYFAGDAWNLVNDALNNVESSLKIGADYAWSGLDGLIDSGLSGTDSAALDAWANGVGSDVSNTTTTQAALIADRTVVIDGVAQATVNVVVEAAVYDKGAVTITALTDTTAAHTMRIAAGTNVADTESQLSTQGWESSVVSGWNTDTSGFSYDIDTTHYTRTATFEPEVGTAGLSENITYTYRIKYVPVQYQVTAADCDDITDGQYGYGYTLTLPKLESENQVYDYTVNGENYDQGTQYRVTGPTTITRKVGKAWESHNLGELFAKNYAPNDTHVEKILKSVALKSGSIRLRTPSDDNDLLSIAADGTGYVITAKPYNANTEGRQWKPVAAIPVTDGVNGTPVSFAESSGIYTASLNGSFDSILVQYELELNWTDFGSGYTEADAEAIVNLPDKLAAEAKRQLHGMDTLAGQSDNLKLLNENLSMIRSVIVGDEEKGVSQEARDAMQYVFDHCSESVDGNRRMIVYPYVMAYKECATNGAKLYYYYQNNSVLRAQVQDLYEKLNIVLSDEGVKRLIQENSQTAPYYDRLDEIIGKLQDVSASLLPVDTHIDMGNASLASLTDLIAAAIDQTQEYQVQVNDLPTLATTLRIAAPSKVTVNITASIQNSNGDVLATVSRAVTFDKDTGRETRTLTDADADKLNQALESATNEAATAAGVDVGYYERLETDALPGAGTVVSGTVAYTAVYTPKAYTVKIDGGETLSFHFDKPTVVLPAHETEGFRYEYTVDGQKKRSGEYTFTKDQIDRLFDVSSSYTITRVVVDTRDEAIRTYLQGANASTSGDELLNFMALEKNGKVSGVVLRIGVNKALNTSAVQKLGQYLVGKPIGLAIADQEVFNSDDTMLSVNGLVQALLRSGMTLESFRDAINEDGSMKEMAAPSGETVVADVNIKQSNLLGAKLFESTIKFTVSGTGIEMPLYVTMESFDAGKDRIKSIRDGVESVMTYMPVAKAEGGAVIVEGSLPEKYWKGVLSALLVTGMADLDNIKDIDTRAVVQYMVGKLDDLLTDDTVDLNTLGNTLTKMGVSADTVSKLTAKNDIYKKAQKYLQFLLDDTKVTWNSTASQGDTYRVTASVGAYAILDELNIEAGTKDLLKSFIKKETVTAKASVKVKNVQESDYAAIVVGSGGVSFLTDLNTTIATDNTAVVLLKDATGSLNITGENVLVDLRGKTLTGSIAGTAAHQNRVFVADSTLDSNVSGKVTGKVSNAVLTGGTYTGDTSEALLRGGYSKDASGRVTNDYYSIAVRGSTITVTLKATAQSLRDAQRATLPALAADLAADLALNYFSKAQQVTVDGKTLYAANVADITDLFQSGKFYITNTVGNRLLDEALGYTAGGTGNYPGINYLLDDILTKLQDISGLKNAVDTGSPVATYTLGFTGWDVKLTKETGKDYLTVGIAGNGKTETQTLKVVLKSDSTKNNTQMSDALGQLADIVTFDTPITMTLDRFTVVSGKTLQATVSGSGKLTVDMSSDPTYAVMMAVAVSSTLSSGDTLRTELNSAVVHYYTNNDVGKLKTALEKVTCAQVFAALKTIGLHTNFRTLANQAGITDAATLTAIGNDYGKLTAYRGGMAGTGWLLKKLDITGSGTKLSGLKTTEYGTYTYSKDSYSVTKTFDAVKGWKFQGVAMLSDTATVTLKLFAEDKAIVVSDSTGKRVYNGDDLAAALVKANANDGSTVTLNGPVTMTRDETLTAGVSIVNADKLTQGTYKLLLQGNGRLTSDSPLTVESADPTHRVVPGTASGKYIYTLAAYAIRYTQNGKTVYGDDLAAAMEAADKDTNVTVLHNLSLTDDIELGSKKHTLIGMAKVRMGGHQFVFNKSGSVLVVENSTVTAEDCAVDSALGSSYSLVSSVGTAMTTYSLKRSGSSGGGGGGGSYTGSYIYLDVQPTGINAKQLQTAVRKYFNDSSAEVTIYSGLTASGLVANGASIYVSGSRAGSYTVIIMGDTNCNGKTDSGDAVKMRNHYFGTATLSGVALEAADMNRNGKVDAGDAVKNRVKYQNWSGYRSALKITV